MQNMENKNLNVEGQVSAPDAQELSPADQVILAKSQEISNTQKFIEELQKMPQTERTLSNISAEQQRLQTLQHKNINLKRVD